MRVYRSTIGMTFYQDQSHCLSVLTQIFEQFCDYLHSTVTSVAAALEVAIV